MQEKRYLFSVSGLAGQEEESSLWKQVFTKLDAERIKKLKAMRTAGKKASCAGAGLLLQWSIQQWIQQEESMQQEETVRFCQIPLEKLLTDLGEPIPLEYRYGSNGKPYLCNIPLFFNLSHSGEYVACVLSGQEIGVDIQFQTRQNTESFAKRFFHPREQEILKQKSSDFFYRLWTRKEAYGKMTGEGINAVLKKDFSCLEAEWLQEVRMEEYDILEGYKIACCRRKEQRERKQEQ